MSLGFPETGQQPDNGVADDAGSQLTSAEDVASYGYLLGYEMFADAVVDALVVTAQDDQVSACGQAVAHTLVQHLPVRRGVDHLVVLPLRGQVRDSPVQRFRLDDHAGVASEAVIVYLLVVALAVVMQVDNMNLHESLFPGPSYNRMVERTFQQFRYRTDNIYPPMTEETLNPSLGKSTAENSVENSESLNVNASEVSPAVEEAAAVAAAVVAAGEIVDRADNEQPAAPEEPVAEEPAVQEPEEMRGATLSATRS